MATEDGLGEGATLGSDSATLGSAVVIKDGCDEWATLGGDTGIGHVDEEGDTLEGTGGD